MNLLEKIKSASICGKTILSFLEPKKDSVIIFDIDDTLLYSADRTPIEPIVDLYNYAKNKGFNILIITARIFSHEAARFTANELHKNGIFGFFDIYFCPEGMDPGKFKYDSRKYLYDIGFKVEMSVGDRDWDLGEYAGVSIKVPS